MAPTSQRSRRSIPLEIHPSTQRSTRRSSQGRERDVQREEHQQDEEEHQVEHQEEHQEEHHELEDESSQQGQKTKRDRPLLIQYSSVELPPDHPLKQPVSSRQRQAVVRIKLLWNIWPWDLYSDEPQDARPIFWSDNLIDRLRSLALRTPSDPAHALDLIRNHRPSSQPVTVSIIDRAIASLGKETGLPGTLSSSATPAPAPTSKPTETHGLAATKRRRGRPRKNTEPDVTPTPVRTPPTHTSTSFAPATPTLTTFQCDPCEEGQSHQAEIEEEEEQPPEEVEEKEATKGTDEEGQSFRRNRPQANETSDATRETSPDRDTIIAGGRTPTQSQSSMSPELGHRTSRAAERSTPSITGSINHNSRPTKRRRIDRSEFSPVFPSASIPAGMPSCPPLENGDSSTVIRLNGSLNMNGPTEPFIELMHDIIAARLCGLRIRAHRLKWPLEAARVNVTNARKALEAAERLWGEVWSEVDDLEDANDEMEEDLNEIVDLEKELGIIKEKMRNRTPGVDMSGNMGTSQTPTATSWDPGVETGSGSASPGSESMSMPGDPDKTPSNPCSDSDRKRAEITACEQDIARKMQRIDALDDEIGVLRCQLEAARDAYTSAQDVWQEARREVGRWGDLNTHFIQSARERLGIVVGGYDDDDEDVGENGG